MKAPLTGVLLLASLTSGCASAPEGEGWDTLAELKAMRGRTRWHRAGSSSDHRYHKLQIQAYRGSVEIQRFRIHCHDAPKIREFSVPDTINPGRHTTIKLGPSGAVIRRIEFLGQAVDKWANLLVYGHRAGAAPPP